MLSRRGQPGCPRSCWAFAQFHTLVPVPSDKHFFFTILYILPSVLYNTHLEVVTNGYLGSQVKSFCLNPEHLAFLVEHTLFTPFFSCSCKHRCTSDSPCKITFHFLILFVLPLFSPITYAWPSSHLHKHHHHRLHYHRHHGHHRGCPHNLQRGKAWQMWATPIGRQPPEHSLHPQILLFIAFAWKIHTAYVPWRWGPLAKSIEKSVVGFNIFKVFKVFKVFVRRKPSSVPAA